MIYHGFFHDHCYYIIVNCCCSLVDSVDSYEIHSQMTCFETPLSQGPVQNRSAGRFLSHEICVHIQQEIKVYEMQFDDSPIRWFMLTYAGIIKKAVFSLQFKHSLTCHCPMKVLFGMFCGNWTIRFFSWQNKPPNLSRKSARWFQIVHPAASPGAVLVRKAIWSLEFFFGVRRLAAAIAFFGSEIQNILDW